MQNLLEQLTHWNRLTPSRPFLYDGDLVLTFSETYDRALRFAAGIKALGLKRGSRVAPIMFNSGAGKLLKKDLRGQYWKDSERRVG